MVEFDQGMIRATARALKKLQLTASLDVAQEMDDARNLGLSVEEARGQQADE